jgi:hypothetical protein
VLLVHTLSTYFPVPIGTFTQVLASTHFPVPIGTFAPVLTSTFTTLHQSMHCHHSSLTGGVAATSHAWHLFGRGSANRVCVPTCHGEFVAPQVATGWPHGVEGNAIGVCCGGLAATRKRRLQAAGFVPGFSTGTFKVRSTTQPVTVDLDPHPYKGMAFASSWANVNFSAS